MNAPNDNFTADKIEAAVTGKTFYTWEEIIRNPRLWIALLWRAMGQTGKGYKRPSVRHTGRGDDRRKDKLEGPLAGVSKFFRSYASRYASPPIKVNAKNRSRQRSLLR